MNSLVRTSDRGTLPLRTAFDRLFESAFTPVYGEGYSPSASIATNIWETEDAYHVAMIAPGAAPDQFEVTALGKTLTVAGSTGYPQPEGAKAVWREFGPRQFRRQIGLPSDVDAERIEAKYEHGVLYLNVPKAEHAKPRQIKVTTISSHGA